MKNTACALRLEERRGKQKREEREKDITIFRASNVSQDEAKTSALW